jgi:hypothetical protein
MSSSEGFEMLKKWQMAESIVKTLPETVSEPLRDISSPKEVSVKVLEVGEPDLVLEVAGSGRVVSFDVRNAEFSLTRFGAVSMVAIKTPRARITIYEYGAEEKSSS